MSSSVAMFLEMPYLIPLMLGFHHICVLRNLKISWSGRIFICSNIISHASMILFQMLKPCVVRYCSRNTHSTPLLHFFFLFGFAFLNLNWISNCMHDKPPSNTFNVDLAMRFLVTTSRLMRLRPLTLSLAQQLIYATLTLVCLNPPPAGVVKCE
jgi:hypothetical protein